MSYKHWYISYSMWIFHLEAELGREMETGELKGSEMAVIRTNSFICLFLYVEANQAFGGELCQS